MWLVSMGVWGAVESNTQHSPLVVCGGVGEIGIDFLCFFKHPTCPDHWIALPMGLWWHRITLSMLLIRLHAFDFQTCPKPLRPTVSFTCLASHTTVNQTHHI